MNLSFAFPAHVYGCRVLLEQQYWWNESYMMLSISCGRSFPIGLGSLRLWLWCHLACNEEAPRWNHDSFPSLSSTCPWSIPILWRRRKKSSATRNILPFSTSLGQEMPQSKPPWVSDNREVAWPPVPNYIPANLKWSLTRLAKSGEKETADRSRLLHFLKCCWDVQHDGIWKLGPLYLPEQVLWTHACKETAVREVTVTKYQ